jgi:hypothetical protein
VVKWTSCQTILLSNEKATQLTHPLSDFVPDLRDQQSMKDLAKHELDFWGE